MAESGRVAQSRCVSAVFRGVASADLPNPSALSTLTHPTLILAWDTDSSHPVATAERLGETLPNARLEIARALPEVRAWGSRAADFRTEKQDLPSSRPDHL